MNMKTLENLLKPITDKQADLKLKSIGIKGVINM